MLPKPRSSEVLSFTLTRRAVSDFLRGSRGARRLPTDGCLMRANGTLDPPGNRYGHMGTLALSQEAAAPPRLDASGWCPRGGMAPSPAGSVKCAWVYVAAL
jgi:hypothetical protein